MLVPHYLMACFAYYVEDDPLISDSLFDEMSKQLLSEWDNIEHVHKPCITLDDLQAGTGYAIQYPPLVIGGSHALRRMLT